MIDLQLVIVLRVNASALGCQVVFASSRAEGSTDPLFSEPIVGRCIDEVDTGIQDSVQESLRVLIGDPAHAPCSRATQTDAAVTKLAQLHVAAAELSLGIIVSCSWKPVGVSWA